MGRMRILAAGGFLFTLLVSACLAIIPSRTDAFHLISNFQDVIVSSASATSTSHTISFLVPFAIPASGSIEITPEAGKFTIPAGFDVDEVDFAVATTSTSTERTLAASPSATEDGVAVTTGTNGSIFLTLNSSDEVPAGATVTIRLGANAIYQASGTDAILNPTATTSYKVAMVVKDDGGTQLDEINTKIAIVDQVTIGPIIVIAAPPTRFNGLPSGQVAAGNNYYIEISLNTDRYGLCRYATTTDVEYADMTGIMTTDYSTIHTAVLGGFVDGQTYTFYVRCTSTQAQDNDTDYPITFTLKDTVIIPPPPGPGGSGPIRRGSETLHLANVQLSGWGYANQPVTILKDGVQSAIRQSTGSGDWSHLLQELERGRYTFSLFSTDSKGRLSATYAATISVGQGTNNSIANIVIPPTIEAETTQPERGDPLRVSGDTVPGSEVSVYFYRQLALGALGEPIIAVATSTADGHWSVTFDTTPLVDGTYELRAFAEVNGQFLSGKSRTEFIGIGEEPSPDFFNRSDLNKDGKVNLIDFSILLVHWGTSDANADINGDGIVSLVDFSIMIFNWTG